jgi:hypothetical protein
VANESQLRRDERRVVQKADGEDFKARDLERVTEWDSINDQLEYGIDRTRSK